MADVRKIEKALKAQGAVITALHGMGGIGKTATALHAVQRLVARGRFKDAQLFICDPLPATAFAPASAGALSF